MSGWALLGLGFVLGVRHAADPDHVVAVAAITARSRRLLPATLLGAVWGLGHSLTLFAAGGAILAFNLSVPARLGLALEFAVALALVAVGALNLRRDHGHAHDDLGERIPAGRAFVVGIVHGLAGSAAVALLVLATVRDLRGGLAYLGVFGLGTLAGMALVTTGFAAPLSAGARRWPRFGVTLRVATGLLSVAFGLWLAWHIGWVDGLFVAYTHWPAR